MGNIHSGIKCKSKEREASLTAKVYSKSHASNRHVKSPEAYNLLGARPWDRNKCSPRKSGKYTSDDNEDAEDVAREKKKLIEAARPTPTVENMAVINETWAKLKDTDKLGSSVFLRMFQSYPDLQGAFGSLKHISREDTHYEDVLRAHGSRVLGIVKFLVENWEHRERVVEHLHKLGQHHVILSIKIDYIDIVSQMFLFALEAEIKPAWSIEVEHAWGSLFRFLTHVMKEPMTF